MQTEHQLLFSLVVGEGVYEENMCSFLSCGKTEDGRWGSWKKGEWAWKVLDTAAAAAAVVPGMSWELDFNEEMEEF